MKIFVTGGAGYIGSHVVYELCDVGHEVTIYDDMSLGREENIDKRAKFILGSTLDNQQLNKALNDKGFDAVIHLAAWKAAGESMEKPGKYAVNNIVGSMNLINAVNDACIKNFVFSSTAAVYGSPSYLPIDEEHPINPANYYGYTKVFVEENLRWYSQLKGLNYVALRYFNAAGYDVQGRIRGKEKNPNNLLPIIMETACGMRDKVQVYGNDYDTIDGTGVRDYIHVNDLATAHVLALSYLIDKKKNLIVNLSTERGYSVLEAINKAKEITGKDIPYQIVGRRDGDPDTVVASFTKANKILNWKAKYSDLKTILSTMWNIYK
ncbi:MAG: UDP-glucose 4-epimerase GalE [Candidatus Marinimicrobia bacterium]|nr:UDP-glucose 4-epimerase GalE [Candidatus Neomarinimicrobiota bacterium]